METLAKTIQIFLPDGQPRGLRIAEITTRTVQAVLVPRTKLTDADKRTELKNVGVYFLFGESDESAKPLVYIGEAEDCYARLKQNNKSKDFWNIAIGIVSKTNSFTKAHVKYLEWYCLKKATIAGRYSLENETVPGEPYVPEPMQADLMDSFQTLSILTAALGYPLLEATPKGEAKDIFYCKAKGADAMGEMIEDGFVVFAGSKANVEVVKTAQQYIKTNREKMLASGVLAKEDGVLIFKSDYLFKTPSGASRIVLGRNSNGWIVWKNKDGKTLDELKRKQD